MFDDCKTELEEISAENHGMPLKSHGSFECHRNPDDTAVLLTSTSSAPSTATTKNIAKLTNAQRAKVMKELNKSSLTIESTPIQYVQRGLASGNTARKKLVPKVQECVEDRFLPVSSNVVIRAMCLLTDFKVWDYDDDKFGHKAIETIADYYVTSLEKYGFNVELAKTEFRQLKRKYKVKYGHLDNVVKVWKTMLQTYDTVWPNILAIIELCLSIAWAQGVVERGFSATRLTLGEQATHMFNASLDDRLVIKVNMPTLEKVFQKNEEVTSYKDFLITRTVEAYLAKGRRHKLKDASEPAAKKRN